MIKYKVFILENDSLKPLQENNKFDILTEYENIYEFETYLNSFANIEYKLEFETLFLLPFIYFGRT